MKLKYYLLATCLASSLATGSVTLSPAAQSITDASGNPVAAGNLALLVVSTDDSTFGPVLEGSIQINNTDSGAGFLDGNDDAVVQHFATSVNGFTSLVEANTTGSISLDSRFSSGDSFAIYWFPDVTYDADLSNITLSVGDAYGFVSSGQVQSDGTGIDGVKDWVLPADGNSTNYANDASGGANFAVIAVPEPTSTLMLFSGLVGLASRRRR